VLAYRLILFWLPLLAGAAAFFQLRKTLTSSALEERRSAA
jgi:uncharacterized membrane protein YbhN (UPF0104 family)